MGDIVHLVEEAQSREAPVQRLADKVAGHFTYGVMEISAATFMFWNLFGTRILPATLNHGSTVSLALQLCCSVLVVACPCALGLATPTVVLVGTSLGATKGLLLRGGNIFEKFSMLDTVVFDKTGTLTIGKPVVTKVMTHTRGENIDSQLRLDCDWSEVDILKLAAGVESNTIHPIGKAIVAAARAVNAPTVKDKARKATGMQVDVMEDGSTDHNLFSLSLIKGKRDLVAVEDTGNEEEINKVVDNDDEETAIGQDDSQSDTLGDGTPMTNGPSS